MATDGARELEQCLQELYLPAMRAPYAAVARPATEETGSYPDYLRELAQRECQQRQQRRIERLLKGSKLPLEKSWSALDRKRLPAKGAQPLRGLVRGDFLDQRANVLVFGPPGSGKTHALCAVAQEWVRAGRRVLFTTCAVLVQDLLAAKRDLTLQALLKRLGQ
jgi:DNA replication protein DnaC